MVRRSFLSFHSFSRTIVQFHLKTQCNLGVGQRTCCPTSLTKRTQPIHSITGLLFCILLCRVVHGPRRKKRYFNICMMAISMRHNIDGRLRRRYTIDWMRWQCTHSISFGFVSKQNVLSLMTFHMHHFTCTKNVVDGNKMRQWCNRICGTFEYQIGGSRPR